MLHWTGGGTKAGENRTVCGHDPPELVGEERETHPSGCRPHTRHAIWNKGIHKTGRHIRALADSPGRGKPASHYVHYPFGRYAFNHLPFGISSASEHLQRCMSQMLEGCEGVVCHTDDIVVFGEDVQQHNERLHKVLQALRKEGLTLNEKCEFSIEFSTFPTT